MTRKLQLNSQIMSSLLLPERVYTQTPIKLALN